MNLRLWTILVCLPLAALLLGSVGPTPAHLTGDASSLPQHDVRLVQADADWPGWRGPHRDGVGRSTGLQQKWSAAGPKLEWTCRNLGSGYSGPAVVGKRVYLLGTERDQAVAICLDLETGAEHWRTPLGPAFKNRWGDGPRSTPTVADGRVYVLTARGHLACLASESGSMVWDHWLPMHFGGEVPDWGYSESPLVDHGRVIVTPGIETPLVALDQHDGRVLWTSRGLDDGAQYSSAVPIQIENARAYLQMTDRGLVAVAAETGELLCRYQATNNGTAVCPTPVVHGDRVFTTSGHGAGCALVRLVRFADGPAFREVYFHRQMQNHHGGVIRVDNHLFGYSERGGWTCLEFDTGRVAWQQREKLDRGSIVYADGRLYLFGSETGTVVLLKPISSGWGEAGRFTLPETSQRDRGRGGIWTHPVIAQGRLLLRDQELLFSYDLRAK